MRWDAAVLAAVLAMGAAPSRAAEASLTPEQVELVSRYTDSIALIPKRLYGDLAKLQEFVAGKAELAVARGEPDFHRALAILAGVGHERRERARGGGAASGPERVEEEYFRRLEGRASNAWVAASAGGYAYRRRDFQAAFADFERALRLDPRDRTALLGYGNAAYKLGDFQLAALAARRALDVSPRDEEALGLYHFSKDRAATVRLPSVFGDSVEDVSVAAPAPSSASPTDRRDGESASSRGADVERSAAFAREARSALQLRDFPTAYQNASRAVDLNGKNVQARNFRAMALCGLGRYPEAVQESDAALAVAPDNPAVLLSRSWAYAKGGRYQEALKDADDVLRRDAANPFAFQNRAFALAGLGDRAGALESLRRSAELDPSLAARFQRALRLPEDADLRLLFDEGPAAPMSVPAEVARPRRFLRLALMSTAGGLLIALAILNVASAAWREKMGRTVRRVLGSPVSGGPESAAPAPLAGTFWVQYELVKEIGVGGMGVVYEAIDRSLERRVAVKKMRDELRLDPQDRQRFVREARLVAQLHHPNIVDIYGIIEDGSEIYLVFEYVAGITLHDALRSSGPMDLARAKDVLKGMAAAVEHAHAKGVIHRDLKPSNVMIAPDGRVKVMDFGVARQAKDALAKLTMTGTVAGTPPYMAPEQEQGTVRRESDVYALGVCFYEMLTGTLPFTGSGAAMLLSKLNGRHIPLSRRSAALPAELDALMTRALAPDPDKRYGTPAALVAALDSMAAS